MAYTNIDDPSAHFQALTYTGDGIEPRNIDVGFQADLIWAKDRTVGYNHRVFDSSRGGAPLYSNQTSAEDSYNDGPEIDFSSPYSNGFKIIDNPDGTTNSYGVNMNNNLMVSWNWKANGGTTTSVSASGTGSGCVNACTYQANTTAGFSIITYTGRDDQLSNAQESKLTHGLGVAPAFTIMKRTDSAGEWYVMGAFGGVSSYPYFNNGYILLNTTAGLNGNYFVGDTAPDSTHIFLGNELVNIASATYVCYAFAEKQGYSKFGKYVGNGNANGPFVYTGFKPAFLMMKEATSAGGNWVMFDNKRDPSNVTKTRLFPNLTNTDNTTRNYVDLLSNGFKLRDTDADHNESGQTMIYVAFAENPFVTSTGVPTTAR